MQNSHLDIYIQVFYSCSPHRGATRWVEPELTPLGESRRRHLAKGVAPCMDMGIGYGDTTFLKKPMWAKMDIRYRV
jgi:hypothetical protein